MTDKQLDELNIGSQMTIHTTSGCFPQAYVTLADFGYSV